MSEFISVPCPEFLGRPIRIRIQGRNLEYAEESEGYQVPRSASIEEEALFQAVKDSLTTPAHGAGNAWYIQVVAGSNPPRFAVRDANGADYPKNCGVIFEAPARRLESPEAAPAEGVDLESIAPNLIELTRGEPHDDEDCPGDDTCRCANIRTLNAECKALQAALSRSEAAPKAAEAEPQTVGCSVCGCGCTAPESQPHTVHPWDALQALKDRGAICGWDAEQEVSTCKVTIWYNAHGAYQYQEAKAPTLSEAVQAAVDKLPVGIGP